jgi:hypothetical protein
VRSQTSSGGLHDFPCHQTRHSFTVTRRYEMRRQCQEIIPRILLGPFIVSKSLQTLQELGITHMFVLVKCSSALYSRSSHSVCIRNVKEAFSVKARFPQNFNYLELDVEDNEDQNLITVYPRFDRPVHVRVASHRQPLELETSFFTHWQMVARS